MSRRSGTVAATLSGRSANPAESSVRTPWPKRGVYHCKLRNKSQLEARASAATDVQHRRNISQYAKQNLKFKWPVRSHRNQV